MGKKNYSFQEQNKQFFVKEAEQRCLQYLRDERKVVIDVTNNARYYEDGIDLIVKDERKDINIDVKADTYIHRTMNIFYELIECFWEKRNNTYKIKLGWGLNKKLDFIYYVDVENWKLFIMDMDDLHSVVYNNRKLNCRLIPHQNYKTIGFLIPLINLENIIKMKTLNPLRKKVSKEIPAEEIDAIMVAAEEVRKYKVGPPTKEEMDEIKEMIKRVFGVNLDKEVIH